MGVSDVVVHNVRFYNLEPRAIHCMALERKRKKLALSRSDNSVEIWDIQFKPYLQKVIFNSSGNSVEDIKWFNDRLFACGLQGSVVEYDCLNESVLYEFAVTGGPAWCIDVNKRKKFLACGTEDGYINILEVKDEKLQHFKFLDKQQGRILCMCWDQSGQHLVTGSMDVIRVWNVDTGNAIHKMKMGRLQNKETVVWCLAVTSDFTIISGDSRGYLCFWDGKVGTQIESNNSHDADILCLVLSSDESVVYCSGVDPLIATYGRVSECTTGRRKWAKGAQRRIHEHDVRALALTADDKLFSGGIDGYLALSWFPPKVLFKFPPLLKGPCVSIVPTKRYILLRYLTHLELWKLGTPDLNENDCESLLMLNENEVQLLQLRAKKNEIIICASISEDGQFIAFSTEKTIGFYKFQPQETIPLTKLPDPSECTSCKLIQFYQKNKRHFCAIVTNNNEINILEVEESGPYVIQTIKPREDQVLTESISHLVVPCDSPYLIAADCSSKIAVWSRLNWTLHCILPTYKAPVTAIAVRNNSDLVVVAYSNFKVVEFDLKQQKFTKFSINIQDNLLEHLHTPVPSITFDSRRDSSIIFHDDSLLCVIDKNQVPLKNSPGSKKSKKTEEKTPDWEKNYSVNVIKKSKWPLREVENLDEMMVKTAPDVLLPAADTVGNKTIGGFPTIVSQNFSTSRHSPCYIHTYRFNGVVGRRGNGYRVSLPIETNRKFTSNTCQETFWHVACWKLLFW